MFAGETTYLKKRVDETLIGAQLTTAHVDPDDEALVLTFEQRRGDTVYTLEVAVLRDPEGNGPGWLDIPSVAISGIEISGID